MKLKAEAKKKELLKQQVQKRKTEEFERARRARDMIEENRRRVQLQSQLLEKGPNLDAIYKNKLQGLAMRRQVDIEKQMEHFYYQQQLV